MLEAKFKRPREVSMLAEVSYVKQEKSKNLPDNYDPQKNQEDPLSRKVMRNLSVRKALTLLRSSVVAVLCRTRITVGDAVTEIGF